MKLFTLLFVLAVLALYQATSKTLSTPSTIPPHHLGKGTKPLLKTLENENVVLTSFDSVGSLYDGYGFLTNHFAFSEHRTSSSVAALLDGSFIVVWAEYTAENIRIKANVVNPDGSSQRKFDVYNLGTQSTSKITVLAAALPDGGYLIAWSLERDFEMDDQGFTKWAFCESFGQAYYSSGAKRGNLLHLLTSDANTWSYNLAIASHFQEGFVAFWEEKVKDTGKIQIRRQSYDEEGEKRGPNLVIEDNMRSSRGKMSPVVTTLASGDMVLVWKEWKEQAGENPKGYVYAKILNANGVWKDASYLVQTNGFSTSDASVPAVAALNHDRFVVVWTAQEPEQVYFQLYEQNGVASTPTPIHAQPNLPKDWDSRNPTATRATDKGFLIAWDSCHKSSGICEIFIQRFNQDGRPINFQIENQYKDL